jgi:indolepyruvate ferredoxin oxidoreductase alpha subunit
MESLGTLLSQKSPWTGLAMGNYALVRAMVEAGVRVATTYPGSPTPEIAEAIRSIPESDRALYFEFSTNEKVALEIAFGASINGHLSTVFFKSVGLNVASDSAVQLSLMELVGGMVVILGEDPGANSTQNEQDNRHFARMAYIPLFEPATPEEAYRMFLDAASLSKRHRMPVFLRMTTHVCHARQIVEFGTLPGDEPDWTPRFDRANGPYLPVTKDVFPLKRRALAKLAAVEEEAERSRFTLLFAPNGTASIDGRRLGLISASMPALSLLENLEESGQPIDLLKLGVSYPLPRQKVGDFLDRHEEVLVVEELDRVMEPEIKALAHDTGTACRIRARTDSEDLMGELHPLRTWKILSETWPDLFAPRKSRAAPQLAPRVPQLCPGCGHRSAFHAVKRALPEGTITVGDIGCHSLGFYEPYNMGEVLLCMGHSTGTGSGLSIGNESRKVVSFIGDSTLFHAGIPAIINAVWHRHDLTLVVLENGTTAMTGHQPHAGSGEIGEKIYLEHLLEGIGVKFVRTVEAYDQAALTRAVREAIEHKGFSVVIARHPCMLKFVREQRRKGTFHPVQVQVDPDTCTLSHVCVESFACPSFVRHEDGSVSVHEDLCIGDGSCRQTCPVGAILQPKQETKR